MHVELNDMEIKDEHIIEAESLLIGGQRFDQYERIPFIKNLDSIDLLAVPGSGKTTALLAKLYCLSKQLPVKNGSGILVLAHTNSAVDEIEKHLKSVCPILFNYPNFVGTIQSFINKFLVYPYYAKTLGKNPLWIDDQAYYRELDYLLSIEYSSEISFFKNNNKSIFFNARFWYDDDFQTIISYGISKDSLKLNVPKKWKNDGTDEVKINKVLEFIKKTKQSLIIRGILHYDDCYYLALKYIKKYPDLIGIIQKRFGYVFIDEMQDLENYQIQIIDQLFSTNNPTTRVQRIGDINQAIYNSSKKVKVQADWKPRNQMYLNNSNRLSNENASIVNYFTLDRQTGDNGNPRFVVNGVRRNSSNIKPHLVVFNDQTKGNLESTFIKLIEDYSLRDLPEAEKYGFKIIGWNARWNDDEESNNKLRLENIFPRLKIKSTSIKENFNSLSKYLQLFDKTKKTLEPARKAILNSLIAILRIENKTHQITIRGRQVNRFYTKEELINVIVKRENNSDYEYFKSKLYEWSFALMVKDQDKEVYLEIKGFILNEFKNWFELDIIPESNDFIGDRYEKIETALPQIDRNVQNEVKIDIGTVHSAKGQTHCATMYIETSYHDYETNKLKVVTQKLTAKKAQEILPNPLLGQEHSYRIDKDIRAKESMKMMYVGFSRPTHLLCFAVLKDNITYNIADYEKAGWKVIDITS